MKLRGAMLAAAIVLAGVHGARGKSPAAPIRPAAAKQPEPVLRIVPSESMPEEVAAEEPDDELFPPPQEGASETADDPLATEQILRGSGIPSSPYPAGLSYMMAPQPFRVPLPDRIYYPPKHYVHLCPYYPCGVYWGADWNKRILGRNPWLIHGDKRFNPYLTAAKIRHHFGIRQPPAGHGACPHCGQVHAMAAHSVEASVSPAAADHAVEDAEMPQPPRVRGSVPSLSEPVQDTSSAKSPARPEPAAQETRTAGRMLPLWQRPPGMRR